MLEIMNNGQPFTCELITYDEKRKTGGLHRRLQAQVLPQEKAGRKLTPAEQQKQSTGKRHIRRVQLLVDDYPVNQIRTIHIPLIIKFNGESVVP